MKAMGRKTKATMKTKGGASAFVRENSIAPTENHDGPDVTVSMFDYSVENHLRAIDTISKLCGEAEIDASGESEIERLSSTITFLREWRHYNYKPKVIRFAREIESPAGKDVVDGINLPQFSAATIPKERPSVSTASPGSSKDFVLHVGGPIWALDWCPRVHQDSESPVDCEFLAVAAHPPESSYHKIGAPLTGRGVVQIWCLLNVGAKEEEVLPPTKKPKHKSRKKEDVKDKSTEPKRPRGRPRKEPISDSMNDLDCNNQLVQALAVQFLEDSSKVPAVDGASKNTNEQNVPKDHSRNNELVKDSSAQPKGPRGRPGKKPTTESLNDLDGNDQLVQALAVQFPEDSSKVPAVDGAPKNTNEQNVPKDNGRNNELVKDSSAQPKGPRGRPRKKPTTESPNDLDDNDQLVQALAVQFPEDSSKVPAMDGASKNTNEQNVPKDNGRNNELVKDSSAQLKGLRGRPRKKPTTESLNDLDCNNQLVQALAVQFPEDSSQVPAMDGASKNTNDQNVPKDDGRNKELVKDSSAQPKGPRGRPRKKPTTESLNDLDCNNQLVQALAVQFPKDSSKVGRKRKGFDQGVSACNSTLETSVQKRRLKDKARAVGGDDGICISLLTQNEDKESSVANLQTHNSSEQDLNHNGPNNESFENSLVSYPISKDIALPRIVLCLAHNGKVAWDVKWRPSSVCDLECKHRMGYLAVLLGNGSLEVWEVPFPRIVNSIYSSSHREGTDPRFIKMEPIFRCSKLMHGDRESIPLTVEWSASAPYDFILAGCHDGTVALWKFSASGLSKDTRPLLCFSADTVPIRAVAWAPVENDPESANVIVTAGHGGLKFWDIRDPFRPLWDAIPDRRIIYSLSWLASPRCLILSFDDGVLKIVSLAKAACDVPVTGLPFGGTQLQGLHSYYCSSFPIWSVQVSQLTGMVAYCCADGTALRFQLTAKAVEKDPFKNRAPHFLCGSLSEEDSSLTVTTPLPSIPFPVKKSNKDSGDTPRSMRGFSIESNQARANDKKVKGQASDDQILALCYDNDAELDYEAENTLVTPKSKRTPKSKTSSKKKSKDDQALVCIDEDAENIEGKENGKGKIGNEIEVFPPKVVAMHRVRWNMNKGCERWLCYGGAAGILRCQEIVLCEVDKKLLAKR